MFILFVLIAALIFMLIIFCRAWFGDLARQYYEKLDNLPSYLTWSFPKSWPVFRVYYRTITLLAIVILIVSIVFVFIILSN